MRDYDHKLFKILLQSSADPETALLSWIRDGFPSGIECPVDSCGIFSITAEDTPVVAKSRTFDFQFTLSHQNFGSFYENEDLAQADFDRCIVAGFVDEFHALDDKIFGPAKIACLLKVKPDFTVKVRLIVELRSGVNGRVTLRERVVFPRVSGLANSAVDLLVVWRNHWCRTLRPSRTMVKESNSQLPTLLTLS